MLADLPERHFDAMASTDKAEMPGEVGFDIVLAVATGGLGAAGSALAKSRYVTKASGLMQNERGVTCLHERR